MKYKTGMLKWDEDRELWGCPQISQPMGLQEVLLRLEAISLEEGW